jgi:hypothetical protein
LIATALIATALGAVARGAVARGVAALIAARNEAPICVPNGAECSEDIAIAFDLRGIGCGTNDHKIIPRNLAAADSMAFTHEFCLGFWVMDQHEIGIAAPRHIERLTGAERHDSNRDSALPGEERQNLRQESAVVDGSR